MGSVECALREAALPCTRRARRQPPPSSLCPAGPLLHGSPARHPCRGSLSVCVCAPVCAGTMLQEISRATFAYDDFKTVMLFVWRSAQNQGALWCAAFPCHRPRHWSCTTDRQWSPLAPRRVTYKTLNMLDYILRHGSERVIEDAKDHLREIKKLQKFEYVDPDGKDQGVNVREKAKRCTAVASCQRPSSLSPLSFCASLAGLLRRCCPRRRLSPHCRISSRPRLITLPPTRPPPSLPPPSLASPAAPKGAPARRDAHLRGGAQRGARQGAGDAQQVRRCVGGRDEWRRRWRWRRRRRRRRWRRPEQRQGAQGLLGRGLQVRRRPRSALLGPGPGDGSHQLGGRLGVVRDRVRVCGQQAAAVDADALPVERARPQADRLPLQRPADAVLVAALRAGPRDAPRGRLPHHLVGHLAERAPF